MTERAINTGNSLIKVRNPQAYADALRQGLRAEVAEDSGLRGRILRGRTANDFAQLSPPDGRRLVFIMGPDGLSALPGRPLRSAMGHIGLRPNYVQGRIDQGYSFKLLVFMGGDSAPLATWDNALDLIAGCYPELAYDIKHHRQALKVTPFHTFAERIPENIDAINLAGEQHPLFMTLERYLQIPAESRLQDPLALRRLLLHSEHLGPLYTGDGFTRTPEGEIGLAEYLAPNGPISTLQDALVVDLLQ